MKKILIINKSFEVGGVQSSMVNMVKELSRRYQVDLFIYKQKGPMRERLPDNVRILPVSWRIQALGLSFREALTCKNAKMLLYRLFATVWTKLFTNKLPIANAIRHQEKLTGYDLAIGYHHERGKKDVVSGFSRVADVCTDAKMKIAFLHYDNSRLDVDSAYNAEFYARMDKIVCVSRALSESFARVRPELREKIDSLVNFADYEGMRAKAMEEQETPYPEDAFVCFSACRLNAEKAIVRAVHAFSETFRRHSDLYWYIAGDGPERENILAAVKQEGLEGRIVLMGQRTNPYSYMKNARLVMNVSFHEAAPMVFLEAGALGVPVFASRTSSVDEFLNDGYNAFVCENTSEALSERFARLMEHREAVAEAAQRMKEASPDNEASLQKLEAWLARTGEEEEDVQA